MLLLDGEFEAIITENKEEISKNTQARHFARPRLRTSRWIKDDWAKLSATKQTTNLPKSLLSLFQLRHTLTSFLSHLRHLTRLVLFGQVSSTIPNDWSCGLLGRIDFFECVPGIVSDGNGSRKNDRGLADGRRELLLRRGRKGGSGRFAEGGRMKWCRFCNDDCWCGWRRSSDGVDLGFDDRLRRDRCFQIPIISSIEIYRNTSISRRRR